MQFNVSRGCLRHVHCVDYDYDDEGHGASKLIINLQHTKKYGISFEFLMNQNVD